MSSIQSTDLLIIGGGPAGYQSAIRAGQLKIKTIIVEQRSAMGGTCLNEGCIPSKHLLHASQQYNDAKNHWQDMGINSSDLSVNIKKLMLSKDKVVQSLRSGIDSLIKKNKITRIIGTAAFVTGENSSDNYIEIKSGNKKEIIVAKKVLITTGSEIINLPNITIDEKTIVSSTGALSLSKIPKTMIIIGAGVIGLELGSVWHRLGTKVTFIEAQNGIMSGSDEETAKQLQKILTKQGLIFQLGKIVKSVAKEKTGLEVKFADVSQPNKLQTVSADIVLVAVGRKARCSELQLAKVGIEVDSKGFIKVDKKWQTSRKNVFAAGDVIGGPMLAHKAGDEAIDVINSWFGHTSNLNYSMVPSIVYTNPECASVGATQEQLRQKSIKFKKAVFPFLANSRSRTTAHTEGQVTLLVAENGVILGAHIIGPEAGNLIHECLMAMEFGACIEDIALTCHGHPTYNEAIREAAMTLIGGAIHI